MKKFTAQEAEDLGKRLGVDWNSAGFSAGEFLAGLNVELEHGTVDPETDVTGDDPLTTAKIALAHLKENRLYYDKNIGVAAWESALDGFSGDPAGKSVHIL